MKTSKRIHLLERLLDVCHNLSASLELEPYLQSVIATASDFTGSEVASILELEDCSGQLRIIAFPWFFRDDLKTVKVPVDGSIAGWVFQNSKPVIVPETAAEPRHYKAIDQAAGFEIHSILTVLLIFKGETLVVLETVNKTGHANYTEEDLKILETLAFQAAIAIQNSRLPGQAQISHTEVVKEESMVGGDSIKIGIALSNLVKNAITFTDPGGHILIATEQIPGYVKVTEIDDGAGIPAKDLSHILERFFQIEPHQIRKHGGLGLVLSVAKVLTEINNGHIWAESVEGKGSNFTFLPPLNSSLADAASNALIS